MKRMLVILSALCILATGAMSCRKADFHESVINVYVRPQGRPPAAAVMLSWEDAKTLLALLESAETVADVTKCETDYIFEIEGRTLVYHAECGTLQDISTPCAYLLSDEEQETVNEIIRKTLK